MTSNLFTGDVVPEGYSESVSSRRRAALSFLSGAARFATFLTVAAILVMLGLPGFGSRPAFAPDQMAVLSSLPAEADAAPIAPSETEASGPAESADPAVLTQAPAANPTSEPVPAAAAETPTATATAVTPTAGPAIAPPRFQTYRVQPGDTLLALSIRFGITPETVLWANDLGNGELLLAGQDVVIPPVSGILHTIQKGDTISAIAETYVVDAAPILAANDLNPAAPLPEGGLIVVPGGVRRTTQPIEGLPSAPSQEELARSPRYLVRDGDNLVAIADAFGVRPSVIQVANGLLNPDLLRAGQELAIPGGKPVAAGQSPAIGRADPSATPRPAPTAAQQPSSTALPTQASTAAPPPAPAGGQAGSYVVKAGDTIYSIARSLGVQPLALQEANGITDPTRVRVGQTLVAPQGAQPPAPTQTSLPAATSTPTRPPAPSATPVPQPATPTSRPAQPPAATATTVPPSPAAPIPSNLPKGDRIAAIAQKYLGLRYLWGGHSPTGFDCTGFAWYVYKEAGYSIPQHDLQGQLNAGPKIPREQLAPGDLVFFQNTYTTGLSHVGIFLGGGRFINAETERVGVQIRSLNDPYWSSRFTGASRP